MMMYDDDRREEESGSWEAARSSSFFSFSSSFWFGFWTGPRSIWKWRWRWRLGGGFGPRGKGMGARLKPGGDVGCNLGAEAHGGVVSRFHHLPSAFLSVYLRACMGGSMTGVWGPGVSLKTGQSSCFSLFFPIFPFSFLTLLPSGYSAAREVLCVGSAVSGCCCMRGLRRRALAASF